MSLRLWDGRRAQNRNAAGVSPKKQPSTLPALMVKSPSDRLKMTSRSRLVRPASPGIMPRTNRSICT